jgi:hypothetical protein
MAEPAPLTYGQEQHHRALVAAPGLRTSLYVSFRIGGPVRVPALLAALADLVRQHDAFRGSIYSTVDGLRQRALAPPPAGRLLTLTAVRAASEEQFSRYAAGVLGREVAAGWGPDAYYPFRFRLLRASPTLHALLGVFAHSHFDGRARDLVVRDLWAGYRQRTGDQPHPPVPLAEPFLDAARAQRARFAAKIAANTRYWRDRLTGCPPRCEFGTPVAGADPAGGYHTAEHTVAGPSLARLHARRQADGGTQFQWAAAAFASALFAMTAQDRIAIHLAVDSRRAAEREVVGMFATVLPLVIDRPADPAALPATVARELVNAVAHQHVEPAALTRAGDRGPRLDRDVAISFVAAVSRPAPAVPGLRLTQGAYPLPVGRTCRGLELSVRSAPEALQLSLVARADRFSAQATSTICRRIGENLDGQPG